MAEIALNLNLDDDLFAKIEKEYSAGNYTGAVKTAILFLTECIRDRTDLDLDGDQLITNAFSANNPLIKFNSLRTNSEVDEQTGHMMILQGLYKGIRNPRNHNLRADDRFTCESILVLVNYYVSKIKQAKLFFDFNDFFGLVKDRHFDKSAEYSDELIKTIPQNKLFDTMVVLLNSIDDHNFENVGYIVASGFKALNENDRDSFFAHCGALLQRASKDSTIKALIFALRDNWDKVDKIARIRTESLLIEALKNMSFDEYQDTDEYSNYYTRYGLNDEGQLAKYLRFIPLPFTKRVPIMTIHNTVKRKMELGDPYVKYIFRYFDKYIFRDDRYVNSTYNDVLVKLLDDGNETVYQVLTSGQNIDDEFDPNYAFDDVIDEALRKVRQSQANDDSDDDIPF